jgi:hypothetical protein
MHRPVSGPAADAKGPAGRRAFAGPGLLALPDEREMLEIEIG